MKPRRLLLFVALATPAVAVGAWLLTDSALVHGAVIGAAATLGVLGGGLTFVILRVRKKMESPGGLEPPPLPGSPWDYDMTAETLDGGPVHFERFRGRVLVLNFWATWCRPCLSEMPSLEGLRARTADFDVAFALVTSEDLSKVRTFVEKEEWELPVYVLSDDPPERFAQRAIPATYVLDRHGTIQLRHVGAARWDDPRVVSFVRGLAATPDG